jgi:hypothetical protein
MGIIYYDILSLRTMANAKPNKFNDECCFIILTIILCNIGL